jgi:hypothetical protein
MLLGLTFCVLGLHGFYLGALARVLYDYSGETRRRWLGIFSYTRSVVASAVAVAAGAIFAAPLVVRYIRSGLALSADVFPTTHLAVTGLLLIITGFMNFTFTLALHAAAANVRRK